MSGSQLSRQNVSIHKNICVLGEKIKQARKNKGFTLAELGEKIGLTHTALSKIENNKNDVSKKTLISLAKALSNNFGEEWLNEYLKADETPKTKQEIAQEMSVEEFLSLKFGAKDVKRKKEKIAAIKLILADEIEDIDEHGY